MTSGALNGREGLEVLFDDGTDAPFALHIVVEQTDRRLPEADSGHAIVVAAWGRAGKLGEWPGRYRTAATLPYMKPWRPH